MDPSIDLNIKKLSQQVKHNLITLMGKTVEDATPEEFYRALSWAFREEVVVNWAATKNTFIKRKCRKAYYISMEWLLGRLFVNNITNIGSIDLVKKLIQSMGRDWREIVTTEMDPGLGNGGLGRLAACYLDSLATHHYPVTGYGLRYHYGMFEQEIWAGTQIERPECWLLNDVPWEFRRDAHATHARFGGNVREKKNKHGEITHELVDFDEVRALAYDIPIVGFDPAGEFSVLTLRLFSTKESPQNFRIQRFNAGDLAEAAKLTALTDVLYPNDANQLGRHMRIKQEFLLITSAIQDIFKQYHMTFDNFDEFADKVRIQLNDTHPALVIAELMRKLTVHHEHSFAEAFEITKAVCGYTNHTVLREALEEWDQELLHEVLPRQMYIIEKINFEFCNQIRSKFPNDEERVRRMSIIEQGRVKMAHLAIYASHKVNGVAALHSEILKKNLFKDFYEMFPERFTNVTNGVTPRRWLYKCNPLFSELITSLIGDAWIKDLSQLQNLHDFAKDPSVQQKFIEIKDQNKQRLIKALCAQKKARYGNAVDLEKELFLESNVLFDVQVKRIHEYKRQLLKALHAVILYNEIKKDPNSHKIKRKILIAGKAAPGYVMAKNIIRFICLLGRKINADPVVGDKLKIVFVENYNVSKAELIIPAADLSEQISTAGQEASGTGNMKLSINGALTIGTEDGANIEMRESVTDKYWPFRFGMTSDEVMKHDQNQDYNAESFVAQNPLLREAVDRLKDDTFAENEVESEALQSIYNALMIGSTADRYYVLKDLPSYLDIQQRVEELFLDRNKWAEYALHNVAAMGKFSSDRAVATYADEIWGIQKQPLDLEELDYVRKEYASYDRCNIA